MVKNNIPPKPASERWTDEQWKAIYAHGQDILISAAAGSGKTAVLVERIIRKITNPNQPLNIDELLVVTFTDAAAAEMRQRVASALEEAISEEPASNHLRKQLSLINRASISTLHSFCQQVIRKYYYLIDLDPGFRIADDGEMGLVREEVISDLLEKEYSKQNNDQFLTVVNTFTRDRSDADLEEIILKLYDFARSNPYPNEWLKNILTMYEIDSSTKLDKLPFIEIINEYIDTNLQKAQKLIKEAYRLTKLPNGPIPRAETYEEDLQKINQLIESRQLGWESLSQAMSAMSFSRVKSCRRADYDDFLYSETTRLRNLGKDLVEKLKKDLFFQSSETMLANISKMREPISGLIDLVIAFSDKFTKYKKDQGIADYSDLEHYCLEIFRQVDADNNQSEAATYYKNLFQEVLVDEYQDTSMVQEAIINFVKSGTENDGNLFMVGDVKQSIYRFRLAEPNLFLNKYNRFNDSEAPSGLRIDLAKNFRSRREILHGTNFIFKQIMGVDVGEMVYDEEAELQLGANYNNEQFPIEVCLIDRANETNHERTEADESHQNYVDLTSLDSSQLEAQYIAEQIKAIINNKKPVYNLKNQSTERPKYKDIVILLRSLTKAPEIMAELKKHGIPVYAELTEGYFAATEVNVMMSLLKIIDNPYQDIPLAAVLRSPIVGLNEDELAQIRLKNRDKSFYDSLKGFYELESSGELYEKVAYFYEKLQSWRKLARQTSLSKLIWQLYEETKYFDFVGGLPGGKQRQANLTALYNRAQQYEQTSFRGLFRFLRFIEKMLHSGRDLGTAHAIGEQENVVRIMSIHKSKGLEFPIVFIAGLNREFNKQELHSRYFIDKDLGFATNYINYEKQIESESLQKIAFIKKKWSEQIAEEMRILYVALTRAKEKLFLIAAVNDLEKELEKWQNHLTNEDWLLDSLDRSSAKHYLDWLGPALIRHSDSTSLRLNDSSLNNLPEAIVNHDSNWQINIIDSNELATNFIFIEDKQAKQLLEQVATGKQVAIETDYKEMITKRLKWEYDQAALTTIRAKQSVSEIKRFHESTEQDFTTSLLKTEQQPLVDRPQFMQAEQITPAEKGTITHTIMQHIPLDKKVNQLSVITLLDELIVKEILTEEQVKVIDPTNIVVFFNSEIGQRLLAATTVYREIPFSMALPASEVYEQAEKVSEPILIQGIIDCLFEDEDGFVLLDYKTDQITGRFKDGFSGAQKTLKNRYETQINLYSQALEKAMDIDILERYLYFFDGGHTLKL